MTDDSGQMVRLAMSDHDTHAPLSADELMTLASEMEESLIANECQFSHPDWRYVDGLRALARVADRLAPAPAFDPSLSNPTDTKALATPAPSPVSGEPDAFEDYTPENMHAAVYGKGPLASEWADKPHRLVIEASKYVSSLLSDRERMTRRIAELEADEVRLDELSRWSVVDWQWGRLTVRCVTADARLAYGPREITGATLRDAAAKLVIARASLPSDPDHE